VQLVLNLLKVCIASPFISFSCFSVYITNGLIMLHFFFFLSNYTLAFDHTLARINLITQLPPNPLPILFLSLTRLPWPVQIRAPPWLSLTISHFFSKSKNKTQQHNTNQAILDQPTPLQIGTHMKIIHKQYNRIAAQQSSSL
jgi:hypothetical protein